jgi:hypothetical protein
MLEPSPWAMGVEHALNSIALQNIAHRGGLLHIHK